MEKFNAEPQEFIVVNAGLCLLFPWLHRLFIMLDYLDDSKWNFKDEESQIRAVFLLQYIANGEEKEYKDTGLEFIKLLVGLSTNTPIPQQVALTDTEKQTADSLLEGVKSNWSKMQHTSAAAFRMSFITRTGRLEKKEYQWILTVDRKAFDVLLDSLPWSYRMIMRQWMKIPIEVNWHNR